MRRFVVAFLTATAMAALAAWQPGPQASAQHNLGGYDGRNQPHRPARPQESSDAHLSEIGALEEQCLDAVNRQRESRGIEPLRLNPDLLWVARDYSRRMAEERFFDHKDPDGYTVRDRVREAGFRWRALGENLAYSKGYVNPVAASIRGWMDSPGHRRNILEPTFEETAVGVWISPNGTVYFTEIFIRQ